MHRVNAVPQVRQRQSRQAACEHLAPFKKPFASAMADQKARMEALFGSDSEVRPPTCEIARPTMLI